MSENQQDVFDRSVFPYLRPTDEIREEYRDIFDLEEPIPIPLLKRLFDIIVAALILLGVGPILLIVWFINWIEGVLIADNKGPMFFFYWAVSQGRKFRKYKIRLVKMRYIDEQLAAVNDWRAYRAEWSKESRTNVGAFVKKYYLDELPQIFSILRGDMSFVGPRPLAVIHYDQDLSQGNPCRKLLVGGLLGLGHIHKGTDLMGDPRYELAYVRAVLTKSQVGLLLLDLKIILRGIRLVKRGEGL